MELSCGEYLARSAPPKGWTSPLTRSPSPARRARARRQVDALPDGRRASLAALVAREKAHAAPVRLRTLPHPFAQIREEVVAWFVDVGGALDLASPVTAVATAIFDRFAAARDVAPALLNTLAATALVIAAKVVEDDPPPPDALVRYTGVMMDDVRALEAVVLAVLDWRLHLVTVHEVAEELRAHLGAALDAAQLLTLDALALAALMELPLADKPPTAIATAMMVHMLELTPRADHDDVVEYATLKVNVYVLARDSGFDVECVNEILPVLRASMEKIFDSTEDFNDYMIDDQFDSDMDISEMLTP